MYMLVFVLKKVRYRVRKVMTSRMPNTPFDAALKLWLRSTTNIGLLWKATTLDCLLPRGANVRPHRIVGLFSFFRQVCASWGYRETQPRFPPPMSHQDMDSPPMVF
jgi:hypothetical protein